MSALRLYFDADSMQRGVLAGLRARGVDAITAQEAGMVGRSDEEHVEFARSQGRVVFSFNVSHFSRIHAELQARGQSHAGIIVASQQRKSYSRIKVTLRTRVDTSQLGVESNEQIPRGWMA
jgi:hypothetical protein